MTAREAFARILREKRRERGLSQEALADRAGLSTRSISLFEHNHQQPTLSSLEALAHALDLTLTDIVVAIERERDSPPS